MSETEPPRKKRKVSPSKSDTASTQIVDISSTNAEFDAESQVHNSSTEMVHESYMEEGNCFF